MVNLTDGSHDTMSGIKAFISNNGYTFPVYYDLTGSAADTYEVYSIPETLFIRADGSLYDVHVGALSESGLNAYIEKLIEKTE